MEKYFELQLQDPRAVVGLGLGIGLGIGLSVGLNWAADARSVLHWMTRRRRGTSPRSGDERVLLATRIHCRNASETPNLEPLSRLMRRSASCGCDLAIAVGIEGELGSDLYAGVKAEKEKVATAGSEIAVLPVQPWGQFVPALHALLGYAATEGYEMILFQSVEIETSPETLRALVDHLDLDDGDLVVGVAIQGHEFKPGTNVLTGRTTPWNTLALWNTQELAKTGFLGVAEGWVRTVGDEGETVIAGGVEEVTAISAAQSLSPSRRARAKLLKVPGITWETQFKDAERRAWHERKMRSKLSRAQAQLSVLKLPTAYVEHIDLTG